MPDNMQLKKNEKEHIHPLKDKLAKGIAAFLLSIQSRFAMVMSSRINSLSIKAKRLCLVAFCLGFGGFSIYAFIEAYRGNQKPMRPSQVSVPKYYDRTGVEIREPLTEGNIKRINQFKKYMDSLIDSENGQAIYDSILKSRPKLMDSILEVEKLYEYNIR
jgi:hypothetical protein